MRQNPHFKDNLDSHKRLLKIQLKCTAFYFLTPQFMFGSNINFSFDYCILTIILSREYCVLCIVKLARLGRSRICFVCLNSNLQMLYIWLWKWVFWKGIQANKNTTIAHTQIINYTCRVRILLWRAKQIEFEIRMHESQTSRFLNLFCALVSLNWTHLCGKIIMLLFF